MKQMNIKHAEDQAAAQRNMERDVQAARNESEELNCALATVRSELNESERRNTDSQNELYRARRIYNQRLNEINETLDWFLNQFNQMRNSVQRNNAMIQRLTQRVQDIEESRSHEILLYWIFSATLFFPYVCLSFFKGLQRIIWLMASRWFSSSDTLN